MPDENLAYVVTMLALDDDENVNTICKSHDELTNLVLNYDRERYLLLHVEMIEQPVLDYRTFITSNPGLEFGNSD